jgi:spore germination cell wall hydrolase CwlJ-like protein
MYLKLCSKIILILVLVFYTGTFFHFPQSYFDEQHEIAAKYHAILNLKKEQQKCIVEALWYEARSETEEGMRHVASVLLNRTQSKHYPSNLCAVVRQPKQFSYRNHLGNSHKFLPVKARPTEQDELQAAERISQEIITGRFKITLPKTVLWYHTTRVNPYWTEKMEVVKIHGSHVFLKKGKVNEKL